MLAHRSFNVGGRCGTDFKYFLLSTPHNTNRQETSVVDQAYKCYDANDFLNQPKIMKNSKGAILFLLCAFILNLFVALPALAQFEGTVTYSSFEIENGEQKKNRDQFVMHVTPDRIMLQGENKYDFIGNIKTEGVLIRLDNEDFVFLTGDTRALKISKTDITSMLNMFDNGQGRGSNGSAGVSDADISYEKTGETKSINGYRCEKFIFRDREDRQSNAHVWMTRDLKINWGMLSEPWGNSAEAMINDSFPMSLIFKDGYLPLRMESYRDGSLRMVTEVENIQEGPVDGSRVEVPQGIQLLSFQDYLFQRLSEN